MYKLLLPVFLLFSSVLYAQSISSEEAGTLAKTLINSKHDTAQINILLKLAKYHVFKPGENKADLDSAAGLIKKAVNINADIKSTWANGYILLVKSYLLRETNQGDSAKATVKQSVDILKNEADKSLAGEAYFDYSGYFDFNDNNQLEERISLVQSAVTCFEQTGNLERLGASLHMLGDLHQINGTELIALQKLQQALDVYASIHHDAVQGIYSLMCKLYSRRRDYTKALDYGLMAIKTADKVGDNSIQMAMINTDVGQILFEIGEKEKSLDHYKKALEIAEKYKDYRAIYITSTFIANNYNALENSHEALKVLNELAMKYPRPKGLNIDFVLASAYLNSYIVSKEYNKALPYCKMFANAVNNIKMNDFSRMLIYSDLIKFYIASRQYDSATKYLAKDKVLAYQVTDAKHRANYYKMMFLLDSTRHNYRSALNNMITFKQIIDSIYTETASQQTSELQVYYETDKKEKDIIVKNKDIAVLTKQSLWQQEKNEKDRLTRNATIVGAGLLLLVLILVYSRYLIKQKTNRKLQQQQEQINQQNLSLQALVKEQNKLLEEKGWLLKEIHHRVKNNLQIVMSLLNSQSAYIDNDAALTAIHDSQHRVHAMSLIHQKLYNTENVSSIDMSFYIHELVSYLSDSFNTGQRIRFGFNIEPLELDVSQAIPLGLILNEAITNSIKYAFPDGRDGIINVSLFNTATNHYLLSISDNGIGIPVHSMNKKKGSLGMSLITGLSEDLDGNFSIENNNGTIIKISFIHDLTVKRPDIPAPLFVINN